MSTVNSKHFHIIAGTTHGITFGIARYDNYEDSVDKMTTMSTGLFGHLFQDGEKITIEGMKRATGNGDGKAIIVGTPGLCLCWFPCEECNIVISN